MNIDASLVCGSVFIENADMILWLLEKGYGAKKLRPLVRQERGMTVQNKKEFEELSDMEETTTVDVYVLTLLDEEALYLLSQGTITIQSKTTINSSTHMQNLDVAVGVDELWTIFSTKNTQFALKYKVYTFFKDQGFVIRNALNYGLDYAIYRDLPAVCHSELGVLVVDACSQQRALVANQISWNHLTSLTRVLPTVSKILLVCYVVPATSSEVGNPLSPEAPHFPSYRSLEDVQVHPVTWMNRRHQVSQDIAEQSSVLEMQLKYRKGGVKEKNVRRPGVHSLTEYKEKKRKTPDFEERQCSQSTEKKRSRKQNHWKALHSNGKDGTILSPTITCENVGSVMTKHVASSSVSAVAGKPSSSSGSGSNCDSSTVSGGSSCSCTSKALAGNDTKGDGVMSNSTNADSGGGGGSSREEGIFGWLSSFFGA